MKKLILILLAPLALVGCKSKEEPETFHEDDYGAFLGRGENDVNDNVFDSIWAYHQEEVLSLIEDYNENIFTTQSEEDKAFYQEIASIFKDYSLKNK